MGISEEGGKAVSATVDALKNQPLALSLVLVNLMFLAGGMYTAHDFFQRLESASLRKDAMVQEMMKHCLAALPREDR